MCCHCLSCGRLAATRLPAEGREEMALAAGECWIWMTPDSWLRCFVRVQRPDGELRGGRRGVAHLKASPGRVGPCWPPGPLRPVGCFPAPGLRNLSARTPAPARRQDSFVSSSAPVHGSPVWGRTRQMPMMVIIFVPGRGVYRLHDACAAHGPSLADGEHRHCGDCGVGGAASTSIRRASRVGRVRLSTPIRFTGSRTAAAAHRPRESWSCDLRDVGLRIGLQERSGFGYASPLPPGQATLR
jgi:hypothetical protein